MNGTLEVKNLGKSYKQWGNEWRRCASWLIPSVVRPVNEKWVLKDVNFKIEPGMTIGVIGQNGAGKSTLLKMVAGTVKPTIGSIEVNGRIAAILELGMGFNMDLTGRQNVYHSAGLMGYSLHEINEKIQHIEAFSEIGDYFDQPVRIYSSGMQMRVAFSVATAFKPDVLIVDEVLSVGDSYFQHKSFGQIKQFRDNGASIMLVTHNMSDVRSLCDRVILLDGGEVLKDGHPDEVVDYYNALIAKKESGRLRIRQARQQNGWLSSRSGTGEAHVENCRFVDPETGTEVSDLFVGQQVDLCVGVRVNTPLPRLVMGYSIRDRNGVMIWGTNTWHTRQIEHNLVPGEMILYSVRFTCTLGPGSYSVSIAVHSTDTHLENNYEWNDNLFVFDVHNVDKPVFVGVSWIDQVISVIRETVPIRNGIGNNG